MNLVMLSGTIESEIKSRVSKSNKPWATFTVESKREFSKTDECDYAPCQCWGAAAEEVIKNGYTGARIVLKGRFSSRTYQYQGQDKMAYEVVAEQVEILGGKGEGLADTPAEERQEQTNESTVPF